MTESLIDAIQRIIEFVVGLGFVVPIVIFLVIRLISGKVSPQQQQQQRREQGQDQQHPAEPPEAPASPIPGFPFGGPAWMEMVQPVAEPEPVREPAPAEPASQWGRSFERDLVPQPSDWGTGFDRPDEATDEVLRWGSAFDRDSQGEPIRWTSAFEDKQQNVYGWESAKWGGTFAPRSSEPIIQYD